MENANYGISPEEELSTVMKDIEKNIQEEIQDEEIIEDDPYAEDSVEEDSQDVGEFSDGDDSANVEDVQESISEEESVNETDLYKEKYYLEKKKRKSVLADRQKLEQENYQLKNALDGTIDSNTKLYARDLYNDLEKAKNLKKQALLGDDPDLLIEADEIHQKLLHKVNEFESYVASKAPDASDTTDKETESEENHEEKVKLSNAQEWLNERSELVEGSYNFNPKIQKELGTFIEQFDRELKRNGREDEILTDAYLDVLDEFIDSVKINRPKDGYTTSNVGGVRNNFSNGSSSGSIKVTLTEFDKSYAKNLGISEKEYLKYKIEDIKESKSRR